MAPSISPSSASVFIWSSGILFADLAHGETDMDQHPVAGHRLVILQQAEIDFAPDADDVHQRGIRDYREKSRRSFLVWLSTCDILFGNVMTCDLSWLHTFFALDVLISACAR